MKCVQSWRTILGTMAVLVTLILSSPGVQLARAGEGDAPASVAGDSTSSDAAVSKPEPSALPVESSTCGPVTDVELTRRTDRIVVQLQQDVAVRAAAAASAAAGASSQSDGIVLNNRGYNYGAPRPH
jgi:hypothetical protein